MTDTDHEGEDRRDEAGQRTRWYRIPVVWLGIVVLLGSLAGSVYNIVVSLQLADDALAEVAPGGRFQLAPDPQSTKEPNEGM